MQNYTQFYGLEMSAWRWTLLILLVLWTLFWKAIALWQAVKRDEKKWFVAILILNTFSILELIYLFYIVKIKSIKLE